MRWTRSVGYAIGILLRVHRETVDGQPLTAARIARGCRFPPRFLYRVLRRLVDAGIMTGVSGPGGGYALARPARRINLLQILEAVEGPLESEVLVPVEKRQKSAIQKINKLVKRNDTQFKRSLKQTTLASIDRAR